MQIEPGCCHPLDGKHTPNEPSSCCHVHAENLPANRATNVGEPDEPERAWTAQRQAQEDKLKEDIEETKAALDRLERQEGVHRHGFR